MPPEVRVALACRIDELSPVLAIGKISSYTAVMPRRTGLLPLELAILRIAASATEIHGFGVAAELRDSHGSGLTAHGTLYKALTRLAARGLLTARWEPADLAEEQGRPRRRLYRITDAGRAALVQASVDGLATRTVPSPAQQAPRRRPVTP